MKTERGICSKIYNVYRTENFCTGTIYLLQAAGGEKLSIADSLKATAEAVVMEQSGFVYDQNSGLYYDYNTGYYYDNVSTLVQ